MIILVKIIFYVSLLVLPHSFFETSRSSNFKDNINIYNYRDTFSIIGQWDMCSEEFNKADTQFTLKYLVCPVIQFNLKGDGKVVKSDEVFYWRNSNDTLTIKKSKHSTSDIFTDSIYTIKFEQKKGYIELKIIDMTRNSILILGK